MQHVLERNVVAMCTKCKTAMKGSESAFQKWNKCGTCGTQLIIFSKE